MLANCLQYARHACEIEVVAAIVTVLNGVVINLTVTS